MATKKSRTQAPRGKTAKKDKQSETPSQASAVGRARFRLSRSNKKARTQRSGKKLSSAFRLFRDSWSFVRQYWRTFGGITLVYFLLTVFLVGFGLNTSISELKSNLGQSLGGSTGDLGISLVLFSNLISSTGSASTESGGVYRTIFALVVSLAVVWSLRQLMAGYPISIRDAFYKGMYPLVPATLVVLVMGLQLVPFLIGSFLYSAVIVGGAANTAPEFIVWGALILLLITWSLYMLTSSVFAFYIVTLPDMRPLRALRSARELVRYRRWMIMRKLLFLSLTLLIILACSTLPVLLIWTPLAPWVFMFFSLGALVFAHTYVYGLYKELL